MEVPKISCGSTFDVKYAGQYFDEWKGEVTDIRTINGVMNADTEFGTIKNPLYVSYLGDAIVSYDPDERKSTILSFDGRRITYDNGYVGLPIYSFDAHYTIDGEFFEFHVNGHDISIHVGQIMAETNPEMESGPFVSVDDSNIYVFSDRIYASAIKDGVREPFRVFQNVELVGECMFSPNGFIAVQYKLDEITITNSQSAVIFALEAYGYDRYEYYTVIESPFKYQIIGESKHQIIGQSKDTIVITVTESCKVQLEAISARASMRKLYDEPDLFPHDITFVCSNGKHVTGHNIIVSAASDVLHRMINGEFEHDGYIYTTYDSAIVDLAVQHMYGIDIAPSGEYLFDLLLLADEWMIQSLFNAALLALPFARDQFLEAAANYTEPIPDSVVQVIQAVQ